MTSRADYDRFAWLYNKEWGQWADNIFPFLRDVAGKNLPLLGDVLDLCCGTGQLAKVLTGRGYNVTGVDISAEQLRYARKNAPGATFIKADARSFTLPCKFDIAFSTYDALNHILKVEELQQAFNNISNCLKKGGVFIFDLNTERAFATQWAKMNQSFDKADYFYVVHGDYDKEKRLGGFHITIFQQKNQTWKRTDLDIYEKYYPLSDVKTALKKAGFTDIQTYTFNRDFQIQKPDRKTTRVFYYAKKE